MWWICTKRGNKEISHLNPNLEVECHCQRNGSSFEHTWLWICAILKRKACSSWSVGALAISDSLFFSLKNYRIRLTLKNTISCSHHDLEPEQSKSAHERRNEFKSLSLAFMVSALTGVIVTKNPGTTEPVKLDREPEDTHQFAKLIKNLRFYAQEDHMTVINQACVQFPYAWAVRTV